MKNFEIVVPVKALGYDELSKADRTLVEQALAATERAYAPYSKFCVGAAIRLSNGETVTGANQENAAYPSGTCAERTAAYYAHATYPDAKFEEIAVAARGTDGEVVADPCSPCGACRQALSEYEKLAGHNVKVLLVGREVVYELPSVSSLLPFTFTDF